MKMRKLTKTVLENRVNRGIKFMNRQYGRYWLRKIDPETLALESGTACVLGQVEGDYDNAIYLHNLDFEDSARAGFTLDSSADGDWDRLTRTWKDSIVKLQKLFNVGPNRAG